MTFTCEKRPAIGSRAMVVTNHPLASAAGAEVLLAGGNAVDAAVTALFALTVVEPMLVGILGGGVAQLRLADGRHVVIDGLSTAPRAAHGEMYETVSDELPDYRETVGRANDVGALAGVASRDGGPQTAARSGDHADLVVQPHHASSGSCSQRS